MSKLICIQDLEGNSSPFTYMDWDEIVETYGFENFSLLGNRYYNKHISEKYVIPNDESLEQLISSLDNGFNYDFDTHSYKDGYEEVYVYAFSPESYDTFESYFNDAIEGYAQEFNVPKITVEMAKKLVDAFNNYTNYDEMNVNAMSIIYGIPFDYTTIRGFSQGDWQGVIYPKDEEDKVSILEDLYFSLGDSWDCYEISEEDYEEIESGDINDIDLQNAAYDITDIYIPSTEGYTSDDIKKYIHDFIGIPIIDIILVNYNY